MRESFENHDLTFFIFWPPMDETTADDVWVCVCRLVSQQTSTDNVVVAIKKLKSKRERRRTEERERKRIARWSEC